MIRLSALILLVAAASPAFAQDKKAKGQNPDLPTACEIRSYYLDKDGKPADPSDVKAAVIFETKDGKTRSYPMTLVEPKDKDAAVPPLRHLAIDGTAYKMAVGTVCTDASTPGGTTHYDKPFLKPLPVVIEPDQKADPEKRDTALSGAPYFRTYLNEQAISDLASVPYTDASIQYTIRGEGKKVKCFTCAGGVPGAAGAVCTRASEDLKTLEKQIQAKDMESAKVTLGRVKEAVNAHPASGSNEAGRKDLAAGLKDLEAAIESGNRDKALAETRKLREKCEKCEDCGDARHKDKDVKPDPKK